MGTQLVREDFLRPPSTNDVGPSTAIFLHGGEIGLGPVGVEVRVAESVSFRFLFGCASLPLSSSVRFAFSERT